MIVSSNLSYGLIWKSCWPNCKLKRWSEEAIWPSFTRPATGGLAGKGFRTLIFPICKQNPRSIFNWVECSLAPKPAFTPSSPGELGKAGGGPMGQKRFGWKDFYQRSQKSLCNQTPTEGGLWITKLYLLVKGWIRGVTDPVYCGEKKEYLNVLFQY